jgi:L-lactate dehydrogenase complex protein LldG
LNAREEVLARARAAIAHGGGGNEEPAPRDYRARTDDGVDTFVDRLRDYGAGTRRVLAAELADAVRAALSAQGARRVVTPGGLPEAWFADVEALADDPPLDPHTLDGSDGVVTTCAVAIAQTGTIVLDGSSGMGRRALTLVPDYHLCVVPEAKIVASVPEALGRLEPTRPLTFVSGPSATVDIEMVRVQGVHGPRRLDVLIVGENGD